jgi:pyruvate/2-oxoglutarate dehydrogenase complex dihydrolipoamide acyltransferase (E2) component
MPARDENPVSADLGFMDDAGAPLGEDGLSAGTDRIVMGEPEPMPAFDENPVGEDRGWIADTDGTRLPDFATESEADPEAPAQEAAEAPAAPEAAPAAPRPARRAGEGPAADFPEDWVRQATKGELDLDKED